LQAAGVVRNVGNGRSLFCIVCLRCRSPRINKKCGTKTRIRLSGHCISQTVFYDTGRIRYADSYTSQTRSRKRQETCSSCQLKTFKPARSSESVALTSTPTEVQRVSINIKLKVLRKSTLAKSLLLACLGTIRPCWVLSKQT
jgi:hypothetical protein